jgi:hypothetical protein
MRVGFECLLVNLQHNPIIEQGGNTSLEWSARFINALVPWLPTPFIHPSLEQLTSALESAQNLCKSRARQLVFQAYKQQQFLAEFADMQEARLRNITMEDVHNQWIDTYGGAVSIHSLSTPPRPRAAPFQDELP